MTRCRILRALANAVLTMLAALATMFCALAIEPQPGTAVLAVVLSVSLSRSQLDRDLRGRIEAVIMLPVVGLVSVGVAILLRDLRWVGAVVFVAGLFVSIWLRRFGTAAHRVGALVALPFIAILVTPFSASTRASSVPNWLVPVIVALFALVWVAVFHQVGRWTRMLPPTSRQSTATSAPEASTAGAPTANAPALAPGTAIRGSLRPIASTRMALQMASALVVSFLIGYLVFPERWAWIVLTAFIVSSGNRGRLDVAYKSVLRVGGAAVGTVAALLFTQHFGGHDAVTAALILVAVFLGLWLRPLGYAWWALFVTLALALLQGFDGVTARLILFPRLEEIVIGAIIGVASAWFILPVRSIMVLRRRLADALAALSDALDPAVGNRLPKEFLHAVAQAEQVAPAFRALRRVSKRVSRNSSQPADWVDALHASTPSALALIERGATPTPSRRAVGEARKSLRNPVALMPALVAMRDQLEADASQ